jgi:rSAM/selenodomain-associated transferase 2
MVSIIIPTYNEAKIIASMLAHLSRLRGDFEVLVADGASTDRTAAIVRSRLRSYPQALRVLACERHKAVQLNRAAELAHGDVLLFLHADVSVAAEALDFIERALARSEVVGGNFEIAYEGIDFWSRFFTWANRVRRRFGIYYGDSAVFVRRSVFERLGGFKPIPIMDDYEFIRRLERCGRTVCLPCGVRVSDRRWRGQGIARTLASWIWVQGLYSAGVPPERLARWYKPVRGGSTTGGTLDEAMDTSRTHSHPAEAEPLP